MLPKKKWNRVKGYKRSCSMLYTVQTNQQPHNNEKKNQRVFLFCFLSVVQYVLCALYPGWRQCPDNI